MEYFLSSIVGSFGLIDYIVLFFIILYGFIVLVFAIYEEGSIIPLLIFGLVLFGTIIYFNQIKNGEYLAQTIEKNGQIIGESTVNSQKYKFILNNKKVIVNKIFFNFDDKKSNIFVKVYSRYDGESVTITYMGSVRVYYNNKLIEKIDINY